MPSSKTTDLFAIRCENKYYQLEEMEDKENSTTELFLNEDRTVSFGDTDGPMPSSVRGSWNVKPGANDFTMEIYRTFETGNGGTDVGEFEFSVDRIFTGEMTEVGESVAITGVMHDLENKDVGYFNMIDATAERAGLDKRVP